MKKLLTLFLVSMLVFSLVGCGSNNPDENKGTQTVSSSTEDTKTTEKEATEETVEWKEFLEEYEDIVDDYIDIYDKYKSNPTDMSILNDYTNLSKEISEWSTKANKVETDLASNPEALKEYTEALSKITKKLSSVSQ